MIVAVAVLSGPTDTLPHDRPVGLARPRENSSTHSFTASPVEATGTVSDDGIIDPRDTRTILGLCLSVVRTAPIEGAQKYGVFRL